MKIILACLCLWVPVTSHAQKYISEKSTVTFFSKASVEDIAAHNEKSMGIFDPNTTDIAFSIPIGEFEFEKSLMKEHFNEKYMETEKYPKATFQGKLTGFSKDAAGPQTAHTKGQLNVHGVAREVDIQGTAEVRGDRIMLAAKFIVRLEDHSIKIPQLLWKNIAETVEVTIEFTLKPYEK